INGATAPGHTAPAPPIAPAQSTPEPILPPLPPEPSHLVQIPGPQRKAGSRLVLTGVTVAVLAVVLVAVKLLVFSKDGKNDKEDGESQRPSASKEIPNGWTKITIPEGPFEIAMPGQPVRTAELLTAGVDAGLTNFNHVRDSGDDDPFPIYAASCTSEP